MFRYCAMALESDFDEFGYTDASDIEIESEILELGDDYEAPEPEFQRQVQAEFRQIPPRSVPLSHPAVLSADTLPPLPAEVEGLMGLPLAESSRFSPKPESPKQQGSRPAPQSAPGSLPSTGGAASARKRIPSSSAATKTASIAATQSQAATTVQPVATQSKPGGDPVSRSKGAIASVAKPRPERAETPRKTPAKEQIAPLAGSKPGKTVPKSAKPAPIATKATGGNGKGTGGGKEKLPNPDKGPVSAKRFESTTSRQKPADAGNGAQSARRVRSGSLKPDRGAKRVSGSGGSPKVGSPAKNPVTKLATPPAKGSGTIPKHQPAKATKAATPPAKSAAATKAAAKSSSRVPVRGGIANAPAKEKAAATQVPGARKSKGKPSASGPGKKR